MTSRRSTRTLVVTTAWAVSVLVAAGAAWWGAEATFRPASPETSAAPIPTVEVAQLTVGSKAQLTATAVWPVSLHAPAGASGVVTSVDVAPGTVVDRGARLFSIDLRPVQVAVGAVPAFRDLATGATGADVAQLEQFLHDGGWLKAAPNTTFDAATAQAVRAWQATLGEEKTGIVGIGDLIYLPTLPARVGLEDTVELGTRLTAGDPVLQVYADAPHLSVSIGTSIQATPATGQPVAVHAPSGDLDAVIADSTVDEFGNTKVRLAGPAGGEACGAPCSAIPFAQGEQTFAATVVLAPETTGPGVPLAALWTDANGITHVTLKDGTPREVTVVAADRSRAVINGVDAGAVVQLFGAPTTGTATPEGTATTSPAASATP